MSRWDTLHALEQIGSEIGTVTSALGVAATAAAASPSHTAHAPRTAPSGSSSTLTRDMEERIRSTTETSERVMAQNIALLGEVADMTQQVAVLRNEKAALAQQLRMLMEKQEATNS